MLRTLRELVFLRRIARALESLAQSQREQTRLLLEAEERRISLLHPSAPRKVEIGAFDAVEASRRWRKQKLAEGWTEEELEEEYGALPDK